MFKNLSKSSGVQARLILLVLVASLATILLTGLLSYGVARHLLAKTGYERLTTMRTSQAFAVNQYLRDLGDQVMTLSEAPMTVEAGKGFMETYNQLPDINETQKKELQTYYENKFIPKLKESGLDGVSPTTYMPQKANERYLKYHYIAKGNASKYGSTPMDDAQDGSAWSRVHKDYNSRFQRLAKLFDYQDIMLVDVKSGNIVYNTSKEDDLGTNLLSGAYANSPAAKVFQEVKSSKDPFFISFSDFAIYAPSFGKPTMFVGTSVFDGDAFIGVLIFQLDNGRIDTLMTANRNWQRVGMGRSGETYLVGADSTFRSSPRFFLEDPKGYLKTALRQGLSQTKVDTIRTTGTPILVQPVMTQGARLALAGKTGTAGFQDYRGVPVVSSYQPIRFGPFEWGLLAEIDQSELFQGIGRLARNLLLLAALLIPAMAFLTLRMARTFIRPVRRLLEATDQIGEGDFAIAIPISAEDEFGELATALNAMANQLHRREVALQELGVANKRLLRSILPASAVERVQKGTRTMAEHQAKVTLLFAEIEGWDSLSQTLPAEGALQLLKELTSALEANRERLGLDTLQGVGTTSLSACGLSEPRDNHEQRAVECSVAMVEVLRRFNQLHNTTLHLAIGLHAGPLTTGVVNGERLSPVAWGDTITIARGLHASSGQGGILATATIVEALQGGIHRFQPVPAVRVRGLGLLAIWRLVEASGAIIGGGAESPPLAEATGSPPGES